MSEELFTSEIDQHLAGITVRWSQFRGQHKLTIESHHLLLQVMKSLRDACGFSMLIDITAVDFLEYKGAKDRFEVVYILLNLETGARLIVSCYLNEPSLAIASVYSIWTSADWLEREVYDMFGIEFIGHPNFKRLLLPQEFASFPLRKDYPVKGFGERHNFPVITRAES